MARKMLINALYPEECRIAVIENGSLLELEVERADQAQLKGNIYKAPITRIEPSLQAAFLDIASTRNGFLQINDINPSYFNNWPPEGGSERYRPSIQDVLKTGQPLVVQVVKDEREAKGATLTTNLSIPGRYLVLMIGNQRGGVSRKISDEGQRRRLRQALKSLTIPAGMGIIIRTAGINKSPIELQRDLNSLLELWYEIVEKSLQPGGPILLYRESSLAIRTIRDYLTSDIDEILIDDPATFDSTVSFIQKVMPSAANRVRFYQSPQPLFSAFHIDAQIEETNHPEVTLPSGGSIVINATEAVVAIDVNSGRSTNQADVEQTAFETNKEAAEIIAKQLRLRDLGGLIVIDFIDMIDRRHKQIVERALKEACRFDKAKVEIGRISKFGLMEMSRQRLKSSLVSQSHTTCPHCSGRGRVKSAESAALEALRKIQSAVFAGGIDEVRIHMSPAAALLLLNNKRHAITNFEDQTKSRILIYADGRMKPDEYEMELITTKNSAFVQPTERIHYPRDDRSEHREKNRRTSPRRSTPASPHKHKNHRVHNNKLRPPTSRQENHNKRPQQRNNERPKQVNIEKPKEEGGSNEAVKPITAIVDNE